MAVSRTVSKKTLKKRTGAGNSEIALVKKDTATTKAPPESGILSPASLVQRKAENSPAQLSAEVAQLGKGGNKKGTFIGDAGAIHLHLDVGTNDHLKIGGSGARYNLMDKSGYKESRLREALTGLEEKDKSGAMMHKNKSGFTECRAWLYGQLGETVPVEEVTTVVAPTTAPKGKSKGKGKGK